MAKKRAKILVTGGAGFIGSHVAEAYLAKGHQVVIVDNMSHGFKTNVPAKAKFYKADIRNLAKIRKIIRTEQPTVINHHAAIAEVVKSVRDPLPTLEVNVQGTVNLLLAGGEIGIKKFIFASTGGAIYGSANKYPIAEKEPVAPLSPYGLSKQLGEDCVEYYARVYNFNYTIFRYPNVFGPRQDPYGEAGVVAIFTELLGAHRQAYIFGDGSKTRDYVYVSDIARANTTALIRGHNQLLNLGWSKEVSDQQVFNTIQAHFPHSKPVKYKSVRAGEVMRSSLSATLAKQKLNWHPKITFDQGVAKYVTYYHATQQ